MNLWMNMRKCFEFIRKIQMEILSSVYSPRNFLVKLRFYCQIATRTDTMTKKTGIVQ